VLILVVFARLFWRLTHRPPPWPSTMPALEQRIATQTHWVMYACMVVAVVTGYVHVVGLGFPMELLDALGVPPLIPRMERLAVISSFVHRFTVIFLLGLVAIHIAEVYRHHLVLKDNVLGRMWPPFGKTNPYGRNADPTAPRSPTGGVAPD